MRHHHFVVVHAESDAFIDECDRLIRSVMLNLIVCDAHTFTIIVNGKYSLIEEKATSQYLESGLKRGLVEPFTSELLIKWMERAGKMKAMKNTHYNFIFLSDCVNAKNKAALTDAADELANSDTMPSLFYAHDAKKNEDVSDMCEVVPEHDVLSFDYLYQCCLSCRRQYKSARFSLALTPSHDINVVVTTGSKPNTTQSDKTVVRGQGTTRQVTKSRGLYRDKDGMIFKQRDFPKVSSLPHAKTPEPIAFAKSSMRILGFVDQNEIDYSLCTAPMHVTGGKKCAIFSSLHRKCQQRNKMIICSIQPNQLKPHLVYLKPIKNGAFEMIKKAIKGEIVEPPDSEPVAQSTAQKTQNSNRYLNKLPYLQIRDLIDPLSGAVAQAYAKDTSLTVRKTQVLSEITNHEAFGFLKAHNAEKQAGAPVAQNSVDGELMKSILAAIKKNVPLTATVANLKACAEYHGIKLTKTRKADIIEEIKSS